jgi:RNA recognition motif-containing protein
MCITGLRYNQTSNFSFFNFSIMNIFVAKLSYSTEESRLREAFEAFGTVDSVKIIMDKYEGRSKGFGFVEMPDDEEAMNAINELNDSTLDGRQIVVKKARPRTDNRGGSGGGGGGDRRRSSCNRY